MYVINSRNVHEALLKGMLFIDEEGATRPSRNGDVKVIDGPVTTFYARPSERVVFWAERDANPFFHFMEGLWMLAGRNDVKWISQFNSTFAQFSDDNKTFHGAYGHRWRKHFALDQLQAIATILKNNPDDRRAVLQMWDTNCDLGLEGKDFPCNLSILFRVSIYGSLDMTVYNRSNDMIWGAYGANAVHMSMLQEVMASWIGIPVGRYWQVANNFHAYMNVWDKYAPIMDAKSYDPYDFGGVTPYPMVNGKIETWFEDLEMFMTEGPIVGFRDKFFRKVATPIWVAWKAYKSSDPDKFQMAFDAISNCEATDWRRACEEWLERRVK